jgi:hypothetical protein
MSKEINNLLQDAHNTYRNQINETKQYVNKWEGTGLLEGIGNDYEKHNTAILLENQARQLVSEASVTNAGTATDKENWSGVALPLVRRVFAELASKEFVSVQPMNLPSGLIFYLDFKYGTDNDTFFTNASDIMGNTSASGDATGGLYGAGKFGYSSRVSSSAIVVTVGTSASWLEVGYNSSLSASAAAGRLSKVTYTFATADKADYEACQAFHVDGLYAGPSSAGVSASVLPEYTSTSGDIVTFIVQETGTAAGAGFQAAGKDGTIYFSQQPTANSRGDFEDTTPADFGTTANAAASDINIPEINVQLKQIPIIAKTRKLKVVWTPEFAQDLQAYHSVDAEAELTSMLSEYISMEIDLEILGMLSDNALTTAYWDANIGNTLDGSTDLTGSAGNAAAFTQGEWFQTLGTKIAKVSNQIHAKTMRGGANFIVTSPDICTILESIPGYATDSAGGETQFAMGVSKVGAVNNKYTVYKNPYMQGNEIIMGFRGAQFLETGAVYAPYIPLIMTPMVYDPTNFTPRKGVMTRYAKKVVRPEFFGKIFVSGLNTL